MAVVIESARTTHVHVIKGICHALGSSPSYEDAIAAIISWAHAAVGQGSSSTRLFLFSDGLLRMVADHTQGGLKVSRRTAPRLRRLALSTRRPQLDSDQPDPNDICVAFPLMCRGDAMGVLEVAGNSVAINERWDAFEALASQAAIVFHRLNERDDLERRLKLQEEVLDTGIEWTAHELRRPLLGVMTALEHVAARLREAEQDHELIDRSSAELRSLSDLLQDILQWPSRAETLRREYVDVEEVVDEAVRSCGEAAHGRVSVSASGPAKVVADEQQLRVALTNILRNALDYSGEQVPVFVNVRAEQSRVLVTVRDRGPGIPPEEQSAIFDPHVRGRSTQMLRPGSGLGLSIAKRLIEAQGGSVWLESEPRGAAFHIELKMN